MTTSLSYSERADIIAKLGLIAADHPSLWSDADLLAALARREG